MVIAPSPTSSGALVDGRAHTRPTACGRRFRLGLVSRPAGVNPAPLHLQQMCGAAGREKMPYTFPKAAGQLRSQKYQRMLR